MRRNDIGGLRSLREHVLVWVAAIFVSVSSLLVWVAPIFVSVLIMAIQSGSAIPAVSATPKPLGIAVTLASSDPSLVVNPATLFLSWEHGTVAASFRAVNATSDRTFAVAVVPKETTDGLVFHWSTHHGTDQPVILEPGTSMTITITAESRLGSVAFGKALLEVNVRLLD